MIRQVLPALAAAVLVASCADPRNLGTADATPRCHRCHGLPPDTGAHRVHAGGVPADEVVYGDLRVFEDWLAPGAGYAFGCGHCHPTDPAVHHVDGRADVVLAPPSPAVAGDALGARNAAGASWDPATGRCSGVACHSDGRPTPTYATTPPWTAPSGTLDCGGCHDDPPRYASAGAGAAGANSHVQLGTDGREWGHTLGLPGNSQHGGDHGLEPGSVDAAPITCQTCHFASVSGAGPTGFYWLDTGGRWQLDGGDPSRLQGSLYLNLDCTRCHRDGGPAAPGSGAANPLRHVNGRPDVVFDPRTTLPALPALAWLPAAPSRPSRPYWATGAITIPAGVDAVADGDTLSMHLAGASYAPATKTCSSVPCHLSQRAVQWGAPHGGCTSCHVF